MIRAECAREHDNTIAQIEVLVKQECLSEGTGHDWFHIDRVRRTAKLIAEKEGITADMFVVEAAALTHEVVDWKFNESEATGMQRVRTLLETAGVTDEKREMIANIVSNVSFKGVDVPSIMESWEGKIVQDADRLDAMGAIGIARAFALGGKRGQPIHDPERHPQRHRTFVQYQTTPTTTINHFYEKLLLLKERLHTKTARAIAEERHRFMKEFLKRFYGEWEERL